jgi:hypothetical protein
MDCIVFCVVTQCSSTTVRRFGGRCRLGQLGPRANQQGNQQQQKLSLCFWWFLPVFRFICSWLVNVMVFLEKFTVAKLKVFSLMEPECSLLWYKYTLYPLLKQFDSSHSHSFSKIRFNILPSTLKPPKWYIFSRCLVFLSLNNLLSVMYLNIHL